jgi:gluconolactonase
LGPIVPGDDNALSMTEKHSRMRALWASLFLVGSVTLWPVAAQRDTFVPARLEEVEIAARTAFNESPTCDREGNVYFAENVSERIMKLSPTGTLTAYREHFRASGLLFDLEGRLIVLGQETGPKPGKPGVFRVDIGSGTTETLADNYQGRQLEAPNDVTMDRQGRLFFTDRPSVAVFRIDAPGRIVRILGAPDVQWPNGIQISPDDKTLYVVETNQAKDGARRINAYDLTADGTAKNGRIFHDFYPGRSADGLSIDVDGNLYASAGLNWPASLRFRPNRAAASETMDTKAGVYVFSPQGKQLRFIPVPEDTVTNNGFGGPDMKTLYITAGKTLFKVRTEVAGLPR